MVNQNVQGLPPDSAFPSSGSSPSSSLSGRRAEPLHPYVEAGVSVRGGTPGAASDQTRQDGAPVSTSIDAEAESDRLFLGGLRDFHVVGMPVLKPVKKRYRCRCGFGSNDPSVVAEHADRHRMEAS